MLIKYKLLALSNILEQEYHNFSLWYCTSFMSGIIFYFTLDNEPTFIAIFTIFLATSPLIILRKNIFCRFIVGLLIDFAIGMLTG